MELVNQLVLAGAVYLKWGRGPSVDDRSLLVQPVGGSFPEYPPGGITSGIFAETGPTLHSILGHLAKAAADDRVEGVIVTLDSPGVSYAMLEAIRAGSAGVGSPTPVSPTTGSRVRSASPSPSPWPTSRTTSTHSKRAPG